MSLMPYRGTGVVSNLTTGNIGFNYGTGPNGDLYRSYGINVNTTVGVGFSLFGIASRYVAARSKALPCILKQNMESWSFPFINDEARRFAKHRITRVIRYGEQGAAGLLTGTRTYLLDGSGTYTATAMYYDDKGRVVQTRSTNHLGGYDIVYSDLDFTGKPNKTLKEHNIAGQAVIPELYTYSYDHAGRVTKTEYQLNGQPTETLADMTASGSYDELGRLKTKKRHNGTDTEQFDYNIRNWPTKITSGEFEENLYYNTTPSNYIQTYPCYNGNISYSSWTYNGGTRGYQYNYDALNRYTGGYAFINNVMQVDYQYSESFNYDKMGNITFLNRFTAEDISDDLTLQYNGNQLKYVNDNGIQQSIYGLKDYQNKSNTQDEFAYDVNGNMTKDLDRDIVTIRYNLLNLPEVIQFRNGNQIKNLYNAGGQKLGTEYFAKLVGIVLPIDKDTVCSWTYASGLVNQKGTIYIDNKEYNTLNGNVALTALSRVHNAEGYVENITSTPNYYYFRRDHLGNNREVWLANTDTTIQRTQYYPSGLPWAEGEGQEVQNKKYNGKEWIEMHGLDEYDSQARMYYPAIMRTTTLDPLAEKYYSISPYAWCGNNPVNRIDPDGRTDYYNLNAKLVQHVDDNSTDKKLVLTTSSKVVDAISKGEFINVPSKEVLSQMNNTFNKTEETGKEHGFRVGEKGTVSIMVSGSEGDINSQEWKPAVNDIRDKGDLVAYDVHSHPLEKDQNGNVVNYGLPSPSPTDKNNTVGSQPNVVLGYKEQVTPQSSSTIGGSSTVTYVKQIGFYNSYGQIAKPVDFSSFQNAVNKILKK